MTSYLRLGIGPYRLLMATDEVFEVLSYSQPKAGGQYVVWRDLVLPTIPLTEQLGLDERPPGVLIIRGGQSHRPEGLLVDQVLGLVELHEGELNHLPPGAEAASRNFDRVWTDASGSQVLRIRPTAGGDHANTSP